MKVRTHKRDKLTLNNFRISMKRFFFGIVTIIALFATSCQQDKNLGTNNGKVVSVSVNVGIPTSRSFSDGTKATTLQYALYLKQNEEFVHIESLDNAVTLENRSTNIQLELSSGDIYQMLLWADKGEYSPYTVDFGTQTVSVSYENALCNDESRDAFFANIDFTASEAMTINAELKRPFAQVNIGTDDLQKMANIDRAITHSKILLSTYSTFNLATGDVEGESQECEFGYAAIPVVEEVYPIGGYRYLAMSYFLAKKDRETTDITISYRTEDGTTENSRTVGSVPVMRNSRTNIYGSIITGNITNIDLMPDSEGNYEFPSKAAEELLIAATYGGTVTLTEDSVIDIPLQVNNHIVLNLNGYTLSFTHNDVLFRVNDGGSVTIIGEKYESALITNPTTVTEKGANGYIGLVNAGGTMTFNGGEYVTKQTCTIAQANGGQIYVNGGVFEVNEEKYGATYMFNHSDALKNEGLIEISGGRFKNYNPKESASESPAMDFVKDGLSTIFKNSYHVVVDQIVADLFNVTEEIVVDFTKDLNVGAYTAINTHSATAKITINGNGKTITSTAYSSDDFDWIDGGNIPVMSTVFSSANGSLVTVNDLTFEGTMSAISLGLYKSASYKKYNTVLNNVNVINTEVVAYAGGVSPAIAVYGQATLNNCNVYGSTLSELSEVLWPCYDVIAANSATLNINGGKIGNIYIWEHANIEINNGAEVASLLLKGAMYSNYVRILNGSKLDVIDLSALTVKDKINITVDATSTIGKVVANGVEYASIEEFRAANNI